MVTDLASDDEDTLQFDFEDLCNEVVELQNELRAERIEVQQLLTRLKAAGNQPSAASESPLLMPGMRVEAFSEQRAEELRRLFSWLAEHADLEHPQILDVGFEVPILGRAVHLQRVVQWSLHTAPGGKLLLTAPIEHQEPLGNLLASTRAMKVVDPHAVLHFLAGWDLVAGELTTAVHSRPEPSVLLSHRASTQGILVATWPTPEALQIFHLQCSVGSAGPRIGDRVEVNYEGTWYTGELQAIDAKGVASVKCDVDAPGVLTVAPLSRVRRLTTASAATVTTSAVASVVDTAQDAVEAPLSSSSLRMKQLLFEQPVPVPAGAGVTHRVLVHRRTRSSAL